jgi:hypothetical protein
LLLGAQQLQLMIAHQLAVLPSNRLASFLLRPALFTSTSTPASGLQQSKQASKQALTGLYVIGKLAGASAAATVCAVQRRYHR